MNGTAETWLTQEAHDRLQGELEHLQGPVRAEIAKRIEEARDEGDLKENGAYHAAKDDQAQIEGRIAQILQLLRTAKVGEAPQASGVVEPGTVVTATIAGDEATFLVGNREIAAAGDDLDVYSEASPLGAAILGLKIGERATYETPTGATMEVEIRDVQTYGG